MPFRAFFGAKFGALLGTAMLGPFIGPAGTAIGAKIGALVASNGNPLALIGMDGIADTGLEPLGGDDSPRPRPVNEKPWNPW